MVAPNPNIPTFNQVVLGANGLFVQSWYRYLVNLGNASGNTSNPLVVADNDIISPGTFTNGGTISVVASPAGTLLGNSTAAGAPPTPQKVDPSLFYESGTLSLPDLPPRTLWGNPTNVAAKPEPIEVSGLFFVSNTLVATGGSDGTASLALVETVATWGM